jgi:surface carbohydrate biosynthesis protein
LGLTVVDLKTGLGVPHLILPVETAARELDAKLLVSLFAADRGMKVTLGNKALLNLRIGSLAPGVYLSHNFNAGRDRIISIARQLGHHVVAWDEEGLVWINEEIYRRRRADESALRNLEAIFLWGEDQAKALRPLTQKLGVKSMIVGNPRADLLRPELRTLFQQKVTALSAEFGDFILVNSNFGWINHALATHDGSRTDLESAATKSGFPLAYLQHRYEIYQAFTQLIPQIARRFPNRKIVVRPHPSESREGWVRQTQGLDNVIVRYDNDLVPWLLSASHILQNGCTTAVETAMLGRTAISYRPFIHTRYEIPQPNLVSHHAEDAEAVYRLLADNQITDTRPAGFSVVLQHMVASLDGALASERIVDAIVAVSAQGRSASAWGRTFGKALALVRRVEKAATRNTAGSASQPDYISQKFAPTSVGSIRDRLQEFAVLLQKPMPDVNELSDRIFEIRPSRSAV